jgi:hypothetical protein
MNNQRLLVHPGHLKDQPVKYLLPLIIEGVAISIELLMNHVKVHAWHDVKEGV